MKITNKLNLPAALVTAISNDTYTPGEKTDMSVTTLLRPPRAVALAKAHSNELTEDAADRIWALLGQATHSILERAGDETAITEKRFYAPVSGWNISGQIDRYEKTSCTIQDWKITSAYVVKSYQKGEKTEWAEQLNMLAYLMQQSGYEVKALQVVAILRDWSKLNVLRDLDYPRFQVATITLPLWPREKTLEFMQDRISKHQAARQTLPECTPDEQWAKPDSYAVMKEGRKSALRVLSTKEDAETWISENATAGKISIDYRPGVKTRCNSYCSAAPFCDQWKD